MLSNKLTCFSAENTDLLQISTNQITVRPIGYCIIFYNMK